MPEHGNYLILLKSRIYDVVDLYSFMENQVGNTCIVLGDYELIAEFKGKYKKLEDLLKSELVRKKTFSPPSGREEPIVVYALEKELPPFGEDKKIKCYTFMTFENEDEADVGITLLRHGGISCVRVRPLSKLLLFSFPHVVTKLDSNDLSAIRDLMLNRVANICRKNKFELRTTTYIVL